MVVEFDLRRFGITRLADHTGLDEIGIPIWAAIRPGARSVSQSHGKGLTADQARISAVMEAVETAMAETAERKVAFTGSITEARTAELPMINFEAALKCKTSNPAPDLTRRWIKGTGLASDDDVFAPLEIASLDYRVIGLADKDEFQKSSVGLAAHFNRDQAVLHGLLEAIEYDALALAMTWPGIYDACPFLAVEAGVSPDLDVAISMCHAAGLDAAFQILTTEIGIPVVSCVLSEQGNKGARRRTRPFGGHACRSDMGSAASAALLEAVQSRMTDISGAREDIEENEYDTTDHPVRHSADGRRIRLLRSGHSMTVRNEIDFALSRLSACGFDEPVVFDLHDQDDPFYCVAVHCPGLEVGTAQDGYRTGPRAQMRLIRFGLGLT